MPAQMLLFIIIPLISALLVFLVNRWRLLSGMIAVLAALANMLLAAALFGKNLHYSIPWLGNGLDFSLRLYAFSAFIILSAAVLSFLIALYSLSSLGSKDYAGKFFAYFLISLGFINGAVLANNLFIMLFFWEGLLVTLFAMIAIGSKSAFGTATKALIINGICDLCMMLGIIITGALAGTLTISGINLPLDTLGSTAFILLMIGAIAKGGSMPFHSWIPDAAIDAPLPFMAFFPAAMEKLLGIYLLTRISLDMFRLTGGSWVSILLMSIGAITIILAVMMALIQKDYKKLLSYHAISQVGYMILGIGTAVPAGIIGGIFHMINNALYKCGLFLTGGAVEKQTGTTDLQKLGGLAAKMPLTFICFLITALSISGVPPFNGFFSKELVYEGALERGWIFYLAAVVGSFLTAASFLKLGHSAFLGKLNKEHAAVKEVSIFMVVPMAAIAAICVLFGVYNYLPLKVFIQPVMGDKLHGHNFYGMPPSMTLVLITIAVLLAALVNHIFGYKSKKSAIKAVDHIHYAPVLSEIYARAEKRLFDPYNIGMKFAHGFAVIGFALDRAIDWLYDRFTVKSATTLAQQIRKLHTGNYSVYLLWSLLGLFLVVMFMISSL
jgi:formate hydrogenlyase subunit 3/multisubunit Na+/H+ antiporter MnhD subunit